MVFNILNAIYSIIQLESLIIIFLLVFFQFDGYFVMMFIILFNNIYENLLGIC